MNKEEIQNKGMKKEEIEKKEIQKKGIQKKGIQKKGIQKKDIQKKDIQKKDMQKKDIQEKDIQKKDIQKKGIQKKDMQKKDIQEKDIQKKDIQKKDMQKKDIQKKDIQKKDIEKKGIQKEDIQKKDIQKKHIEKKEIQNKNIQEKGIKKDVQKRDIKEETRPEIMAEEIMTDETKAEKKEERIRMLEELFSGKEYKPMRFKDLAALLQVPKSSRHELKEVLDQLIKRGKLILDYQGRYRIPGDNVKVGTFSGTSKGFGFVIFEGEEQDIFIPGDATKGALHGDTVMITVKDEQSGRRKEGEVINILERGKNELVGTFEKSRNFGFVRPDDQKFGKDIFIPKEHTMGAVTGHKVIVKLTSYGDADSNPEGRITEILGHINDPGVDILSIVRAYDLPMEFPEEVMRSLTKVPEEIDSKDTAGRKDIRDIPTVTIDGEDAKDLDDAISISREDGIYHLGVHIADVSNYVKEGAALDKEALKRGTSVYLVDRVIPMLPHKLSNGICSLNPGVDRLALSCFMDIDAKGNVTGHEIAETVIRSDRRMTYTNVAKILDKSDEAVLKEYKDFVPMFLLMQELADILREGRHKRGAINFDFPESKIIVDANGKPIEIKPYERNRATKIIEEFMLIANETIAEDYFWQEIPFVYRTHEAPNEEKIQKLAVFINNFGYSIRLGQEKIHPKELQKLLVKIEDTPEEALISRLTLRSMKQAKYTVENTGHFGLSAKYYCHFTSPIRRYPDLQIHRIIKENLNGKLGEKRIHHYEKILYEVSDHSSKTERRADETEREVEKMKKVEYMEDHIGETFEGVISGLTTWGMYVELPNTIEGMIKVSEMNDDYYIYDEEHYQMVGEHTKKIYNLGQKVTVEVINADKIMRTIDFALVEGREAGGGEH